MKHPFHRTVLRALALLAAVSGFASPVLAQLRDPGAWQLLLPRQKLVSIVAWDGWLVGGDESGGLLLYRPESGVLQEMSTRDRLTSNLVSCLALDDDGGLWVGTTNAGLNRVDADRVVDRVTGLVDPEVTSIAADGNFVYYGTPVGGGRVSNGQPDLVFTTDFGLLSEDVRSVAAYDGKAWFGTAAGVSEFDRQTSAFVDRVQGFVGSEVANDLLAGSEGTFAATDDGVYRLDESGVWQVWGTGPGSVVSKLFADGSTLYALGTANRVWRLDAPGGTWTPVTVDAVDHVFNDLAVVEGRLWLAGQVRTPGRQGNDPLATFWTPGATESPTLRGLFGTEARGVAIDRAGGAWFGTTPVFDGLTHWHADGRVVAYNIEDPDPNDEVDEGLLNALKIAVYEARSGDVYASSFTVGITRIRPAASDDPAEAEYLLLRSNDTPLRSRRIVAIAEDAAGRIWFGSDGDNLTGDLNAGLDILLDPSAPLDPASWLKVTSDNSFLGAEGVFSIDFEDENTVWLSVRGFGLQRWDFDPGGDGSQIDTNTLEVESFWRSIEALPETETGIELVEPRGVKIAADGGLWVATLDQGVFRVPAPSSLPYTNAQVDRLSAAEFGVRLLSNQVRSIALDADGVLWVATDAGLNRVVEDDGNYEATAFTDVRTFDEREFSQFYSPDVLSPIPGTNMRALALDASRDRLFLGTQFAAARLDVGRLRTPPPAELEFGLYPNPVRNDATAVYVNDFEGAVSVKIFTLAGVLVIERDDVEAGDSVWDLRTLSDAVAASGLYLVRVEQDGKVALRTLAVER